MASKEEVKQHIDIMVEKINDVCPYSAGGWTGSMQLVFPDLGTGWLVQLGVDGTVASCDEKIDEEAATGVLEMHSDTFVGVYSGTLLASEAKDQGKFKLRGSQEALIKIFAPTVM